MCCDCSAAVCFSPVVCDVKLMGTNGDVLCPNAWSCGAVCQFKSKMWRLTSQRPYNQAIDGTKWCYLKRFKALGDFCLLCNENYTAGLVAFWKQAPHAVCFTLTFHPVIHHIFRIHFIDLGGFDYIWTGWKIFVIGRLKKKKKRSNLLFWSFDACWVNSGK